MFSGLNNLNDISLSPRFAAICGYTDADIDAVFAPELDGLDREKIRTWYNGYGWCGETRVYNPNDLLLFLRNHEFRCYWRDTGTPSFLFGLLFGKMMKQSFSLMELEGRMVNSSMLSMFEVDSISIEALLFQTGYLTITEEVRKDYRTFYRLDYPNLEEQLSLNNELLAYLDERNRVPFDDVRVLRSYLEVHDFEGFSGQFRAWLARIPYKWHSDEPACYEVWYTSLLHMGLRAIGLEVRTAAVSGQGRTDMAVLTGEQVFIFKFRMAESPNGAEDALEAAFREMRERDYAEKYMDCEKSVHLVAVACGREARDLLEVRAEPVGRV